MMLKQLIFLEEYIESETWLAHTNLELYGDLRCGMLFKVKMAVN